MNQHFPPSEVIDNRKQYHGHITKPAQFFNYRSDPQTRNEAQLHSSAKKSLFTASGDHHHNYSGHAGITGSPMPKETSTSQLLHL